MSRLLPKPIRILIVLLWAVISILLSYGCSNHTSKELVIIVLTDPNDNTQAKLTYRDENAYWSFLSFTKIKDSKHTTPLSSTYIGEINTEPDPNSIEAAGSVISEFIRVVVK